MAAEPKRAITAADADAFLRNFFTISPPCTALINLPHSGSFYVVKSALIWET